ncbi:arsenate reductase ArsC [[Eubacterium] cellulosolvens]
MTKRKVLFICTHNSARSQMAEGLLNALYKDRYEAYSAGTEPSSLNPYAVKAMAEIDIDISNNRTKSVEEFKDKEFDFVITVCDQAKEACPFFPGGKEYIHKNFEDPSKLVGTEDAILLNVRRIRDQIREWLKIQFG